VNLRCAACQRTYPLDTREWRCECGGVFGLEGTLPFSRQAVASDEPTLWRYRAMLPIEQGERIVSLGEGFTPLVEANIYGVPILCKLEFLAPTGSFKDRGTTVLVSALRAMGVERVVEDSSGNAAASLAAYCARAGIRARIFVPANASPAKLAQIAVYGAELVAVEGPREEAAVAAQDAAAQTYYASHYYNPFSLEGLKTFAYEIWEGLGGRAPDNLVFPVGHGTLLLGAYRGFEDLWTAGLIEQMPRLFAVQARSCAPLYRAYRRRLAAPLPTHEGETIAEGIRIARPVRGAQILKAIRETGGAVLVVDEAEIQWAWDHLVRVGLYVEPTSAAALAGLRKLDKTIAVDEITVVPLTGSGMKS
jgi:threonine synthase